VDEGPPAEVELTLLKRHETGRGEETGARALEDLVEGLKLTSIEGKYQILVIDINEAAHNVPGFPPGESVDSDSWR